MAEITTSTGTTIRLVDDGTNTLVILDNPAAPIDMRDQTAGRVIDGGFQPAPFCAFTMLPEALRGIADLITPAPTLATEAAHAATCDAYEVGRRETMAGFAAAARLVIALDDTLRGYEDPGDIDAAKVRDALEDIARVFEGLGVTMTGGLR